MDKSALAPKQMCLVLSMQMSLLSMVKPNAWLVVHHLQAASTAASVAARHISNRNVLLHYDMPHENSKSVPQRCQAKAFMVETTMGCSSRASKPLKYAQ